MKKIKRPHGVVFAGLALNARGAERAIEAGVDEVRYVVVASETFNQKNQGASIDETMQGYQAIADTVTQAGLKLSATIGASFACPFEGAVPVERVAGLAKRLADGGAGEIGLADTIGAGVPTQVTELLGAVRDQVGRDVGLGCHLHNTRNTGFANAAAAVAEGVEFLDSSVGGLGGCPFAPKATGNIATEDLAFMLRNMGYETGIDLEALIDVATWVESFFEAPLPGQVMKAGLFPEVAQVNA
jgi:hydroxymethylglutaryl-CoA lyase